MPGNLTAPGPEQLGPYCYFFSYARDDGKRDDGMEDPYFVEFFQDLRKEIGDRTGLNLGEVCFYDKDGIPHGAHWPTDLAAGLRQSRSFLYLLSPRYLQREYCVKEWAVFRARLRKWKNGLPIRMLPVLWVGRKWVAHKLPPELSHVQDSAGKYPAGYAEYGVKGLRRLRGAPGHETAYDQFIVALAEQVAEMEQDPLPEMAEDLPDLTTLPAAWTLVDAAAAPPPAPLVSSPRVAHFAFLTSGEPGTWRPFPVGVPGAEWLVRSLALSEGVDYVAIRPDQDWAAVAKNAADGNHPLVVLLDASTLPAGAAPIRELIARTGPGGPLRGLIVMSVWSTPAAAPPPPAPDAEQVWSSLVAASAGNPEAMLERVGSAEELTARLGALLTSTVIRLATGVLDPRRVDGQTTIEKPTISGPGGTAR